MTEKIVVLSLANPRGHVHGGAVRLRGFRAALAAHGYDVEVRECAQAPTGESGGALWQAVGRIKREFLPLPLVRRRSVRDTDPVAAGALLMSTVPAVTYALTAAGRVVDWADYFDLPHRFAESEAGTRTGVARRTTLAQARRLARHHARSVRWSRLSTYAGYGDSVAAGDPRGRWLPPAVEPVRVPPPPDSSVRVAGFLGNFDYWPNIDALAHLAQNWRDPLVRGGFEIVVGGFGAEGLGRLPPGMRNLGTLSSPEEFYAAVDVVLVPVRRGSGIKVKAIEGLLSGRPVIVDPHVLDGFPEQYGSLFEVFRGQPLEYRNLTARTRATVPAVERAAADFRREKQVQVIGELLHHLERRR